MWIVSHFIVAVISIVIGLVLFFCSNLFGAAGWGIVAGWAIIDLWQNYKEYKFWTGKRTIK